MVPSANSALRKACVALVMGGMASLLVSINTSDGNLRRALSTNNNMADFSGFKPRDGRTGSIPLHRKPVMYTFYNSRGEEPAHDQSVIMDWFKAWYDAGWQPKILTMKDVREHPDYETYREFVETNHPYSQTRIWRWFAMSAIEGGGWLSDIDVYPLGNSFGGAKTMAALPELPNGGKLTTYLGSNPMLVSGSRSEWDRMAHLMIKDAKEHKSRSVDAWGDLEATRGMMQRAHEEGREAPFLTEDKVIRGQELVSVYPFNEEQCGEIINDGIVAVIFAEYSLHQAVESGFVPGSIDARDHRHDLATEWLAKWAAVCKNSEVGGDQRVA